MRAKIPGLIVLLCIAFSCARPQSDFCFEDVARSFSDPGVGYRPAPFWVWNGEVDSTDVDRMLKDFKAQGFGGVFVHPRPGMVTQYLSEDWFNLWSYSLDRCKELGLDIWIYDENSYPSGFGGGHVTARWPETWNHPCDMVPTVSDTLPADLSQYDFCAELEGKHFLYKGVLPKAERWTAGYPYVDLTYAGTTEHFIEATMEGYKARYASEFGKQVKGVFTDEPKWQRWTPDLPEAFRKDWGRDLEPLMPLLEKDAPGFKQLRYQFIATKMRLFIDRWSKPWHDYCESKGLVWTGHYWEHRWPDLRDGGDNMAMYEWHQQPGIDMLFNQYDSVASTAQWGNVRSVKELRSVANQVGQRRTLSESYGGAGWDLTFEDMKRLADWEYALGVNFMCQHYSGVTIEGARKFDYPDFFTRYSPWWENYKYLNDHVARLSLALSQGEQLNDILLIEPNSTIWMYYTYRFRHPHLKEIGQSFQSLVTSLNHRQVEFDLGSETIIRNRGSVKNGRFVVGERAYSTVIIPPLCENLFPETAAMLEKFVKQGGRLIALSEPSMEAAEPSDRLETLWRNSSIERSVSSLDNGSGPAVFRYSGTGDLQHHRRTFRDGELLFLANTSLKENAAGSVSVKGEAVLAMDTFTGGIHRFDGYVVEGSDVRIDFDIAPAGHMLFFVARKEASVRKYLDVGTVFETPEDEVKPLSETRAERMDSNYLTLDFCDLTIDGKTQKNLYVSDACTELYKHFGWLNPWERQVQYKDNIVALDTFSTGDITVRYRFFAQDCLCSASPVLICEKPGLWEVSINGEPLKVMKGVHVLDAKDGCYDLADKVRDGENIIELHRDRMSVFAEISFAFIGGEFGVVPASGTGWRIVPSKSPGLGSWVEQGLPFYNGAVAYRRSFDVPENVGDRILRIGAWKGTVCEVWVNGEKAGIIFTRPYEMNIGPWLKPGKNEVEVHCIGSNSNLYGPHFRPRNGAMTPKDWYFGAKPSPASDYVFDQYGLYEEFTIE